MPLPACSRLHHLKNDVWCITHRLPAHLPVPPSIGPCAQRYLVYIFCPYILLEYTILFTSCTIATPSARLIMHSHACCNSVLSIRHFRTNLVPTSYLALQLRPDLHFSLCGTSPCNAALQLNRWFQLLVYYTISQGIRLIVTSDVCGVLLLKLLVTCHHRHLSIPPHILLYIHPACLYLLNPAFLHLTHPLADAPFLSWRLLDCSTKCRVLFDVGG